MKQKKKCSKCGHNKLLDQFNNSKNGKYGKHHYCRKCNSIFKKEHYNRERVRDQKIQYDYGITPEDFTNMIINQGNRCFICSNKFESRRKTFIDHNHKTGMVRALLCPNCNTLIGHAKENPAILQSAITYLKIN